MKKLMPLISLAIVLIFLQTSASAAVSGIGEITETQKRELSYNAELSYMESDGPNGLLKTYLVTGNAEDVEMIPYEGRYARSYDTLSSLVEQALDEGLKVVAAINADFFYANGLPRGSMVRNGKVICGGSSDNFQDQNWRILGIRENGLVALDTVKITGQLKIGGVTYQADNFNRPCVKQGFNVFSDRYYSSTSETDSCYNLVLKVNTGDFGINDKTVATVISKDKSSSDIPINKGEMVISVLNSDYNSDFIKILETVKTGDIIEYSLKYSKTEFSNVENSIGTPDFLIKNGEELPMGGLWMEYPQNYPSSAIGFKNDGGIVMFQADGRNSAGSAGIHPRYIAQYLKSIGCNNAVMFDGGGSSEIVTVENGRINVLNSPSDGQERKVSNALLMVKRDKQSAADGGSTDVTVSVPSAGSSGGDTVSGGSASEKNETQQSGSQGTDSVQPSDSQNQEQGDESVQELDYPEDGILKSKYLRRIKGLKKGYLIKRTENGSFKYSIEISGENIKEVSDLNLDISENAAVIDLFPELKKGKAVALEFGFSAESLSDAEVVYRLHENGFEGSELYVYLYDKENGKITGEKSYADLVGENIEFRTNGAEFLIITDTLIETAGSETKATVPVWVLVLIPVCVLAAGAAVFFIYYRKNLNKGK